MRALHVAASGMAAQQTRIDTVANNLANVNTTGFKKSRATFQDVFYEELAGGARGARADLGGGSKLAGLVKNHSAGTIEQTGNTLHVALAGPGMMVLEDRQGNPVYSRDGSLRIDADGRLRGGSGLPLMGQLIVPEGSTDLQIDVDGTMRVRLEGDDRQTVVGQIELVQFVNNAGLRALGSNNFAMTEQSGDALPDDGSTEVRQGFLETSNVDVAEELIALVTAQRAYELNSKVIQAADEALQVTNSLKR
ncbi:MAG: flagellar hook-basal body complex protein [Myxococcota bacterium]